MSASRHFDWQSVHARLEQMRLALEGLAERTPEESRRILHDRALALAQSTDAKERNEETIEVVEFTLAAEAYLIETKHVREISRITALTPLPGAPAFVLGIVNIRGEILAVIDLRTFFDFPPKGITNFDSVIVLRSETTVFAVVADAIDGARQIERNDIQPPLPTQTGMRHKFLKGITRAREVLLDGDALIGDQQLVVRDAERRPAEQVSATRLEESER